MRSSSSIHLASNHKWEITLYMESNPLYAISTSRPLSPFSQGSLDTPEPNNPFLRNLKQIYNFPQIKTATQRTARQITFVPLGHGPSAQLHLSAVEPWQAGSVPHRALPPQLGLGEPTKAGSFMVMGKWESEGRRTEMLGSRISGGDLPQLKLLADNELPKDRVKTVAKAACVST